MEIFKFENHDYNIIIGKNKFDNFKIIDEANSMDIWFHLHKNPSCHIILKTNNKKSNQIPRQVLKRCAYLCKINSKIIQHLPCEIIYTTINNIEKTNIIGEVKINSYKTINI